MCAGAKRFTVWTVSKMVQIQQLNLIKACFVSPSAIVCVLYPVNCDIKLCKRFSTSSYRIELNIFCAISRFIPFWYFFFFAEVSKGSLPSIASICHRPYCRTIHVFRYRKKNCGYYLCIQLDATYSICVCRIVFGNK